MEGTASVQLLLPSLGLLPNVLVDDPQLGHLLANPLLFGIDPRHAPACVRVFHKALPIPDQLANVELVVQYPVAAATVADMREVRGAGIAMIFQEPMTALNPLRTIGDQIAEMFSIHTDLSKSEINARVLALLGELRVAEETLAHLRRRC